VGLYQSPPLNDPLQLNRTPAIPIKEKRDILVCNLLQNAAKAGDISLDCPAIPAAFPPFLKITITQVKKAILKIDNTALDKDELSTNILKIA
jgi:hypothetical protein